jgi:quercetin dioxygenase-like cupin family protein
MVSLAARPMFREVSMADFETLLRSFDDPDEVREFPFGRFEIVKVAGVALGRATYQPGWKWSVHNAPKAGTNLCHLPHTGTVLAGHGVVQYETGKRLDLLPGHVFHISRTPHDSWVEGEQAYVSLHVLSG